LALKKKKEKVVGPGGRGGRKDPVGDLGAVAKKTSPAPGPEGFRPKEKKRPSGGRGKSGSLSQKRPLREVDTKNRKLSPPRRKGFAVDPSN